MVSNNFIGGMLVIMKKGLKKLSVLVSIIMLLCLLSPFKAIADINDDAGIGLSSADLTGAGAGSTKDFSLDSGLNTQWYTLSASVNNSAWGSVIVVPEQEKYSKGMCVTVTAVPAEGYTFVRWEYTQEYYWLFSTKLNVYNEDGNVISVTMKGTNYAKKVTAVFAPKKYNVTVSVTPSEPADIATVTGAGTYDYNADVVLEATPNNPLLYKFKQWSGDLPNLPEGVTATDPVITFKMPRKDISLVAEFEPVIQKCTVTALVEPDGAGSVTGTGEYAKGALVTIKAVPASDEWEFNGWYMGDTLLSSLAEYSFIIERDIDLIAKFVTLPESPETGSVTIYKDVVSRNYAEEFYATTSSDEESDGDYSEPDTMFKVILTPCMELARASDLQDLNAEEKYEAYISEKSPAVFSDLPFGTYCIDEEVPEGYYRIDGNYYITIGVYEPEASATIINNRLFKLEAEAENGSISPDNDGYIYLYNEIVPLQITPASGYEFDRWENAEGYTVPEYDSETGYFIKMDSDKKVKVIFKKTETPQPPPTPIYIDSGPVQVTLITDVIGNGKIYPEPGTHKYNFGTKVKLEYEADEGWRFVEWQGDPVDEDDQIYMNGNKTVKAVFEKIPEPEPEPEPPQETEEQEPPEESEVQEEPVIEDQRVIEEEEETPVVPVLPKTGGIPAGLFYGIGGIVTVVGTLLSRKYRKK